MTDAVPSAAFASFGFSGVDSPRTRRTSTTARNGARTLMPGFRDRHVTVAAHLGPVDAVGHAENANEPLVPVVAIRTGDGAFSGRTMTIAPTAGARRPYETEPRS
jgi:hypothetical protein